MAKTVRSLRCSYLYSDGTLVQVYEETRNGVKIGDTADVVYGYCKVELWPNYEASHGFGAKSSAGRIVIHRDSDDFLHFARGGKVTGIGPSVSGGSENTKRNNFEVQYVKLRTKSGHRLEWCDVTSVISSRYTVQADEKYAASGELKVGDSLWGDYSTRVWKVSDLRQYIPGGLTAAH